MERELFAYVQGLDDHVRRRIRRRRSLRLVVFVRLGAQTPVVVDRRWPRETANHTNLLHSLTSNVLNYCEPWLGALAWGRSITTPPGTLQGEHLPHELTPSTPHAP